MTDRVNLPDAIRLVTTKTGRPVSIDGLEIYMIPERGKRGVSIPLDERRTCAMSDIVSAIMAGAAA